MTHEFESYTPEEQQEFLQRAKLLEHEWSVGDWAFFDEDDPPYLVVHDPFRSRSDITFETSTSARYVTDGMVWLPTLDDLVRMLGPKFAIYNEEIRVMEHELTSITVDGPLCLAAIRAIQKRDNWCDRLNEVDNAKDLDDTVCAGIHGPGGLHRCREHYLE